MKMRLQENLENFKINIINLMHYMLKIVPKATVEMWQQQALPSSQIN
jgi:hypothetical protein